MDILVVIIVLLVLLLASTWSSARSYFVKGRLAGMEEATVEIIRGLRSHYELAGQPAPDDVTRAVEAVKTFARGQPPEKYRSIPGPAVDLRRCRRRRLLAQGYDVCKLQMTPPRNDKIRFELSMDELLHLTSLAHLGFKKMMPNDRCIEMLRFGDEAHALQGTQAVERLERAIPEPHRPFDRADNRQALIRNWWPPERKHA